MAEGYGYEGRIGRYGAALADELIAVAGVSAGYRALDVGCGTGALTARLAAVLGPERVVGVDPSPPDLAECRRRVPGADIRLGWAEDLPVPDADFDAVLAQLVFGFVSDGPAAAAEMRRVARSGAPVATCVWDFAEGMTVLRTFWDAARAVDPEGADAHDQAKVHKHGTPADLQALWVGAGLAGVTTGDLGVAASYSGFEDLWDPLAVPDGAPGRFLATVRPELGEAVRRGTFDRLGRPEGAFTMRARAWYVLGRA